MRRHAAIALTGIVILIAASASALVAHVLIDRLGDTLLTTDTYDHVSHCSRFVVFATGASIIVFLLARLWSAIFADARRSSTSMRETIASNLVADLRHSNASVRRLKRRAYRMEFFRVFIHAPLHYYDSAPTHLVAWSFDRECRRTDG